MTMQQTQSKWGQAKFGAGRVPALAIAIPSGLILGAGLGLLAAAVGITGSNPMLGGLVFALCLAMPAAALVYALIVDRNTLRGVAERPEESIESKWYDHAAAGSFTDLILVAGLGATILAFIPGDFSIDLKLGLPAVVAVCFASFGIRYLALKRRG